MLTGAPASSALWHDLAAFPPTFNEIRVRNAVHTMGVTIQIWKPKQTLGICCRSQGSRDVVSIWKQKYFSWWNTSSEMSSFLGLPGDKWRRASSGRSQRREHLAGSSTNSGNLNASDYQRWFTSVHFAPSIEKDIAFICIDSLFHNVSLGCRYYHDNGKAWTSKTSEGKTAKGFGKSRQIRKCDKELKSFLLHHRVAVKMLRIKMQMFWDSCLSRYQEDTCVWKDCFDFYHHKMSFAVIKSDLQGIHCFITVESCFQ